MTPLSAFVGRDDVQERLRDLALERRLVTVTGPGGIGKTRLVQQAVGDAAVTVELAPLGRSGDVASEAAAGLGHGSLDEWVMTLADQEVTVVLDSCEHVLPGAASLASTLLDAGPNVRVVATSREPLTLAGEHLLVLDPLPEADAVQLFVDRAQAAGAEVDPEDPTVVALCARLDGLPLAIELAAARARTMSAAEILAHLDHRFELLTGLEGSIAASYDLLDDDEQQAFRRLSGLPGPFTVDVAHDLIGGGSTSSLATLDRLASFVDRSLLVATTSADTSRYHLLDSLRDYGRTRLEATGEVDATGDAIASAMVAEADRAVTRAGAGWSADVLSTILDQFPSYLTAIEWCVAHDGSPERAHALMLPLWAGVHHTRQRDVAATGATVLDRWPDPAAGQAEVEAIVANARLLLGQVREAVDGAEGALRHEDIGPLGRIVALRTLGIGRRHVGDLAGAAEGLEEAHALAVTVGAGSFGREIAVYQAGVTAQMGAVDEALAALVDVGAQATEHDEPIAATWARVEAANLLLLQDELAEARRLLDDALHSGLDLRYHWSVAASTCLLALVETQERGWAAAAPRWRAALEAATVAGDGDTLAETVRAAAGAARASGEDAIADALWPLVPAERPLAALPSLHPDEAEGAGLAPVHLLRQAEAVFGASSGDASASATPTGSFLRDGDGWEVVYGGRTAHVSHRKGLDDLAQLLARPEHEVHCLELMGAVDTGDAGPAMDDKARRAYQQRVRDLQEEIDEASLNNDPARAERAELELDALVEELSASLGLGGRARSEKSAAERARSAVTWRIRAAMRHLEGVAPELARHLQNAVRTGTWCTYRPETAVDWTVRR